MTATARRPKTATRITPTPNVSQSGNGESGQMIMLPRRLYPTEQELRAYRRLKVELNIRDSFPSRFGDYGHMWYR